MRRRVIAAITLAAALLIQITSVNGLALPGGGAPDLLLLCVIAFGLAGGPVTGTVAGFSAGLALDLAPPATQLLGEYALVFCLAGYCAGRFQGALRRSALAALGVAALVAAAAELAAAGLTLALDSPEVTAAVVARVLPWTVLYDLALSPLAVLVVVRVAVALGAGLGREPAPLGAEPGGSAGPAGHVRPRWVITGQAGVAAAAASVTGAGGAGGAGGAAGAAAAVGWLAGPAHSRRGRRAQQRSSALLTGRRHRKGAAEGTWVGGRPAGARSWAAGVAAAGMAAAGAGAAGGLLGGGAGRAGRFRAAAGVPGSAAVAAFRPVAERPARQIWLDLAGKQRRERRRQTAAGGGPGPSGLPRISFGGGAKGLPGGGAKGLPGGGAGQRRALPQIAFGAGPRARPGGAAAGQRRAQPRIAFGTGDLRRPGASASRAVAVHGISFGGGSGALSAVRRPAAAGKQPRFDRAAGPSRPARRSPGSVARFRAGRRQSAVAARMARWMPRWLAGALGGPGRRGGRSAVWRIGGGRRIGGYE